MYVVYDDAVTGVYCTVWCCSAEQWRAHGGKVFSVCWVMRHDGCEDLISCGPDGEMVTSGDMAS